MSTSITALWLIGLCFALQDDCYDSYECEGNVITNANPHCYGMMACKDATIDTSSTIHCSGAYACIDTLELNADKSIVCSGYKGCHNIESIISPSIQCTGNCDI